MPAQSIDPRTGYIPTLDGWRGIAIILVLVAHYAMALRSKYSFLYGLGGIGVSIFFGISGFLICTLLLREIDKRGSINLGNFYRKRTFRIFPVAYAFLLTILLFRPFLHTTFHDIWPAILFIRNYTSPDRGMAQHFWSLAVEEHFYLLLPSLMIFAKGRKLFFALLIGSGIVFLWRYEAMRIWTIVPHAFYRTDFRIDSILDGSIVAFMAHDKRVGDFLKKSGSSKIAAGAVALLILSRFCHNLSLSRSIVAIAIPFILLSTIWAAGSIPFHLLEWAPLRLVGRLSYSIYIWQGLFTANGEYLIGGNRFWFINLIGIFGVSMLSFYFLEQPLIRLGRKTQSMVVNVA